MDADRAASTLSEETECIDQVEVSLQAELDFDFLNTPLKLKLLLEDIENVVVAGAKTLSQVFLVIQIWRLVSLISVVIVLLQIFGTHALCRPSATVSLMLLTASLIVASCVAV